MEKMLEKIETKKICGSTIHWNCSELRGDCSELRGDCSELRGDCSELIGNLDDCKISDEERKKGVNISELVLVR